MENFGNKSNISDKKTALGLDQNIEAALCYVLGFLTGVLFLILDKDNKYIKFHAMQSIVTFLPLFALGIILPFIPFIGPILVALLYLVDLGLWILLIVKASQGERYKLPIAGDFAEQQI